MNNSLLITKRDAICTLVLNRPEKNNSLSPDLLIRLHKTFDELSQTDDIRVVVIRGAGDKAFSAGFDLSALPVNISQEQGETLKRQNPLDAAMSSLVNYPYPVIAMINGYAYGAGCELAICCDVRIASDGIRMGVPAAKLGLVYPLPGIKRFIQALGFARAREIFFSGRFFPAQRARELGLVNYVVPKEQLEAFTYEMAEEMAANAPLSIKGTKRILKMLADAAIPLADENIREADLLVAQALNSEDLKEGLAALLEKRRPNFKGK